MASLAYQCFLLNNGVHDLLLRFGKLKLAIIQTICRGMHIGVLYYNIFRTMFETISGQFRYQFSDAFRCNFTTGIEADTGSSLDFLNKTIMLLMHILCVQQSTS